MLIEVLDSVNTGKEIFLVGDMNARTGNIKIDNIVGNYGEYTLNDSGERLIRLCKTAQMRITNGFFPHKEIHKFTWTQPTRQLKSIIDYIICKQNTKIQVQDVRVQRGAECGSDHHLLRSKLYFPFRALTRANRAEDKSDTVIAPKYNIESLKNDSTVFLYKLRLANKLQDVTYCSAVDMYNDILNKIHEAAYEALGTLDSSCKKSSKIWWNKAIEELTLKKKQLYQKWLSTGDDISRNRYCEIRREVKNAVQKAKNDSWQQKCEYVDNMLGSTKSKEAWRVIKNLRTDQKEYSNTQLIPTDEWITYYKNLLTEDRDFTDSEDSAAEYSFLSNTSLEDVYITTEELKVALRNTKNGRATGPNGIPIELIKKGPDTLKKLLTYVFNLFLRGEELPDEWNNAYITNIYKKGNRRDCKNYRGLSVTNSVSRLYGRIIKTKIEKEFTEDELQGGFRAGRSCVDNVFCLQQIFEKRLAHNLETHVVFIDLQKAYDSVPLYKLWQVMAKSGINKMLIQAVKNMYTNMKSSIKTGQKVSETFRVTKGLRQGCCIAPTLFKIYLKGILCQWKQKCGHMGVQMDDAYLYTLFFADDQVILAEDSHDANYMFRKLVEEYTKGGLTINSSKTEYMIVGGIETAGDELVHRGEKIKTVENYKYLGVQLTNDGTFKKEISSRVQQGRAAIRQMNSLLWNKSIKKSTKIRCYKSVVESILTYGSELWILNKQGEAKIRAVENEYWRRCCGFTKFDKKSNTHIRNTIGVDTDVIDTIYCKRLRWYGHMQRMNKERMPKKVWDYQPDRRRRRGRPRRTWKEEVDTAMEARGLHDYDWRDKRRWRLGCDTRHSAV